MTHRRPGARAAAIVTGLVALTLSISGCGNKGGATTCGEFLKMNDQQQEQVIVRFMKEKGDTNPAQGKVSLSVLSAIGYCNTWGGASDPISNIDG